MTNEYRLAQSAKLVAVFKDTPDGELPATAEQLNKWVVELARKCLDGKSPHEALNTFVQSLTAKDTYLLRQLALDLLQQVADSQTDEWVPKREARPFRPYVSFHQQRIVALPRRRPWDGHSDVSVPAKIRPASVKGVR